MAEFIEIIDNYGKRIMLNIDAISHIREGRKPLENNPYQIVMISGGTIDSPQTSYEQLKGFLAKHNKLVNVI